MVVGLVGPANAGKSTLLGAWYVILERRGAISGGNRFAGSYTLEGWDGLARGLRWTPGQPAQQPAFPPHTTTGGNRTPGLLHLEFREGRAERRAFLIADAPGEWFRKWAINRDGPEAEGARWVSDHADVLLIFADREALCGPAMGAARGALQNLGSRVAAERRGRPVALVWTKADVAIPGAVEEAVRRAVLLPIPDAAEFAVTVKPHKGDGGSAADGVEAVLDWVIAQVRPRAALPQATTSSLDPLFLFGRFSS
jgi:hypothetical protein